MISIGFGDSDFDPQNAIEAQVMRPGAARKWQPEDMNFYNVTPELLAVTGSTGSPMLLAPLGVWHSAGGDVSHGEATRVTRAI